MTLCTAQLAPTDVLPSLRGLQEISESALLSALASLRLLYCPLVPSATAFQEKPSGPGSFLHQVDSGYASGDDDNNDDQDKLGHAFKLAQLRADPLERDFAFRWLTSLILRADELAVASDDAREQLVDDASSLLATLTVAWPLGAAPITPPAEDQEDQDVGITRDFSFAVAGRSTPLTVRLFDADLAASDHTGVGLQSWGAAVVLSDLMCTTPVRLGLPGQAQAAPDAAPRIVELGAGTGLVSLVLAQLLPRADVVATDFHPAVLANLRANIAANRQPVRSARLDWAAPDLSVGPPPLDRPADVLVATDVVYAPQHAEWLRGCASRLLAPHGVFWLLATVRPAGKFEGIGDTVERAFAPADDADSSAPRLCIMETSMLDKKKGVGRGDEIGYMLFKIAWA